MELEQRFWAKVDKAGPIHPVLGQCWTWLGAKGRRGHGQFNRSYAYRFSYELHVGPIPDGLTIDHLCQNPPCVNPAHLEPVTNVENVLRHTRRMTHCKRGHEMNPQNTYVRPNGYRVCRACAREKRAAGEWTNYVHHDRAPVTHCPEGHEFTPENTYTRPDGKGRQCRVCIGRRSRARRKVA